MGQKPSKADGDGSATELFKILKEKFFDEYIIKFHNDHNFYPSEPCVQDFVLDKSTGSLGGPKTYILSRCLAGKEVSRITAAWLPYKKASVVEINLADQKYNNVKYFFTAELSGCRLQIGADARPKVLHIAADIDHLYGSTFVEDMTEDKTAKVTARMDAAAEKAFGEGRSRKYSKGTGYPTAPYGTAVGFFDDSSNCWKFYAQMRHKDGKVTTEPIDERYIVTQGKIPEKS
jgi:hypothetical protein